MAGNQNQQVTSQPGQPETKPVEQPSAPTPLKWDTIKQYVPAEYKDAGVWEALHDADMTTVLKNYAEQAKFIGGAVKIPKPEDTDGWNKFYQKVGRPDDKDGYQYDFPEHSKIDWNKDVYEKMKENAWKQGLTQSQFKAQMELYTSEFMDAANKATQAETEREQKAVQALKEKYGHNYNYNKALGEKAAAQYFPEDVAKAIAEEMTVNPGLFEGLVKLGMELNESGTFGNISPNDWGGLTYESAQSKIQALNADRSHPYWNRNAPGHQAAVEEARRWFAVPKPK